MTDKLKENGIDIVDNGGDKISNCYHSNCYHSNCYTVTSNEPLSKEFIISLRDFGLLGYGQEFYIRQEELKDNKYVVKIVNYVDSSD